MVEFLQSIIGEAAVIALWEIYTKFKVLWIYLALINFATFVIFGIDKHAAIHKKSRIKVRTLLGLCAIGGSPGGLVAMYLFRHKTKKYYFTAGVPVILLLQLILLATYVILFI